MSGLAGSAMALLVHQASFCVDFDHLVKVRSSSDWLTSISQRPVFDVTGHGSPLDLCSEIINALIWLISHLGHHRGGLLAVSPRNLKQLSGKWLSVEFKSQTCSCPSGNLYLSWIFHEYSFSSSTPLSSALMGVDASRTACCSYGCWRTAAKGQIPAVLKLRNAGWYRLWSTKACDVF